MPHTRLLAVVALILAGLLSTSTPVAQAGRAAAPTKRDLPTNAEVVRALPGLKGMGTAWMPSNMIWHYDGVCSSWASTTVRSGQSRLGNDSTGGRQFHADLVQFKNKKRAKRFFASYRAYVRDCPAYWAGVDTTTERAGVPKVGDQRIGYRVVSTPAPEKSLPVRERFTVVVRQGKRLLVMTAELPGKVKAKQMARLTRVAARKMR